MGVSEYNCTQLFTRNRRLFAEKKFTCIMWWIFDSRYGNSACCIDGDGSILRRVNIVPIGSDTLDATCCELADIYSILQITECIIAYYNIGEAHVELGCDREGGLTRTLLNINNTPLRYVNGSHLDLINSTNDIKRWKKLRITGHHISAHQDDYFIHKNLN